MKTHFSRDEYLFILLVFSFGGIFGFLYEELFYYIDLGYLVKRGTTFGPWIPIYGVGAVLIVMSTYRLLRYPAAVFAVSALVCGLLELATGYVLLQYYNIRLWDYNTEIWNWGNVGGYICFRSIAFFGVSGLFFQYIVCMYCPHTSLYPDRFPQSLIPLLHQYIVVILRFQRSDF